MLERKIIELWHISRVALAAKCDTGRHSRMIYVRDELKRSHPDLIEGLSPKRLWFAISDATAPTKPV